MTRDYVPPWFDDVPPPEPPGDLAPVIDLHREAPPTAGDWPDLVPLDAHDAPPPFPLDSLPTWLAAWVEATAIALQVPADVPAMLALGVLAAVIQRAADVQVRDGWREPLCVFVVVARTSGGRKSAVFRPATAPVAQWERDRRLALKPEIEAAKAKRKAIEKAAGKATDPDEAADLASQASAIVVPVAPRVVADDVTPEMLGWLLGEHGSIALMVAEGIGLFDALAGRYRDGKGPSYATFLQAHGGDRIVVDRIGRDGTFIEDPRLTILTATQPEALRELSAVRRSRGTGLLARFLFVLPPDDLGHRDPEAPNAPGPVRDAYATAILGMLDGLRPREDGSRHLLVFSSEARRRMSELCAEIEPRLGEDGDLRPIVDWAGKLAGAVARIAGILHCAEHSADAEPWHREVSANAVERAIAIGRYLLAHALVAFDAMGADPEIERARIVWRRIEAAGWAAFSKRDVAQTLRGRTDFAAARDLDGPLAVLAERGYIRPASRTNPADRRSERFEVRPRSRYGHPQPTRPGAG